VVSFGREGPKKLGLGLFMFVFTEKVFSRVALIGLLSCSSACFSADPEMWEEYNIPAPDASWSAMTVQAEATLAKGQVLDLTKAGEIALSHHPDLVRRKSSVAAANAQVGQALSAFFPQISLGGSYSQSTGNSSGLSGSHRASQTHYSDSSRNQSASLGLSQLIFDFGQTDAAYQRSKHNAQSAAHDLENIILSTLLEVRESYFTYLEELSLLEVADQTVKSFEKHLDDISKRYDVGRGTKADVASASVNLGEARLEALRNKNRLEKARLRLNLSMGLEEDPGYEVQRVIPQSVFDIEQKDAVAQARESRPDLKSSWQQFKAAEQSLIRAKGGYYPSLSLGGTYSFGGKRFPLVRNWSLTPSFSWTIFDSFNTSEAIEEARANLREARADLATVRQQAYLEVNESWLDTQVSRKRMALAKETIESATESLRLVSGRYKVGRATRLEQTDAELALARAKAEAVSSRFDYERSSAKLLENMGMTEAKKK